MEDKEIRFWDDVDKLPNNMEQEEWDTIRVDYIERMKVIRHEGINSQIQMLTNIFERLEVKDFNDIKAGRVLPKQILDLAKIVDDKEGVYHFYSKKWDSNLLLFSDIFKYEKAAKERDKYYKSLTEDVNDNDKYDMWLEDVNNVEVEIEEFDNDIKLLKDDGWIEVLDGYWVEEYIVKEGKVDYYKACRTTKEAVASIKGRIKDLETVKNQNPDDLIIKP
jgi:hypothetical protein